jgi:hypothetical protein
MGAYLRLILPLVVVGCVDLARPPELVDPAPALLEAGVTPGGDASPADPPAIEDAAAGDVSATGDVPGDLDAPSVGGAIFLDAAPPAPPPLSDNGRPCASAGDCRSGQCVDGFCCDGACTGLCLACDVAGSEGHCRAVLAGEDPGGECTREPVRSCGLDGTCDGAGACRKYPAGTECAPGGCQGATEIAAATCNDRGACQPGGNRSCAPNVCNGDTCAARCSDRSPCLNGFFCDGGTCRRRRADGTACTDQVQCGSGHCDDGVCCATECGRSCFACNLAGQVGTCAAVDDGGGDPKGQCGAEPDQACGRVGGCNGRGACKLAPAGKSCGSAASCTGAVESGASACDGAGGCLSGPTRACVPYLCNADACASRCAGDAQCAMGFFCVREACGPAKIAALVVHDAANASSWSAQRNLQPGQAGAHPWVDFAASYVLDLDPALAGLVGREWVRVASASKNFTGGPQATVTLSTASDLYLIVDDRWGATPSFTAGWTDTGANLHVFESGSRPNLPFSVYKKTAQTGAVTLPPIGSNKQYDYFLIVD